jgi:hypothetical protein
MSSDANAAVTAAAAGNPFIAAMSAAERSGFLTGESEEAKGSGGSGAAESHRRTVHGDDGVARTAAAPAPVLAIAAEAAAVGVEDGDAAALIAAG